VETPPSTGNLPFLRTSLVGRRPEIDDLKGQLAREPAFIGLVGMGGVGKTALALAVAHELAAEGAFPDGIFWVDGREHTTLGAILAELGDLLGLDLGQETLSQQRRAVTFRLAGRDALLVLDNLETVEGEDTVTEFLGGLPGPVLVTSRVRPAGAQVIELFPLPADAAVRLFQLVSGLGPAELDEATSGLCTEDLEGHPLAIEVVGALVAAGLDTAELRGYLQEMPLDVLGETATGAGRSVVDALQLSYQRLSPLAQTLLARVSIFAGGFDLAALAALSPEHSRLHQVKGLRELVARSLLTQLSRQRYRLHPVTRQFAYALLGDPAPYHRRAGAHFLTEAGADSLAATEQLFRAGEVAQAAALVPAHVERWINAGRASRAARQLDRFEKVELDAETWLTLCEAQGDLLALLGESDSAMSAYQSALEDIGSVERLARVKRKIGELVRRQQPAEAIVWFEGALAHLDDPESLEAARIYIRMSTALCRQGKYSQALERGQRGLQIVRQMDEPIEVAEADINLGSVYSIQGSYDRAVAAYEEALSILEGAQRKLPAMKAAILSNLASLYHDLGDWEQAIVYHEQSLRVAERLGNLDYIAVTCFNLGDVYTLTGNFDQAEKNLNRCLALWERIGSDYGVAAAYMNVGLLQLRRSQLLEAEAALTQSQNAFETIGSDDFVPEVLRLMSEVALAQNRVTQALEYAQRSLALAQKLEAQMEEGATRRALGAVLAVQGQTGAALEELSRSLALLDELGHRYEAARTRYELGRVYLQRAGAGDREGAITHLRQALETFTRLGAAPDVVPTQAALRQAQLPNQIGTTIA
jgi:tetratricopeptide (TPR) repeat protein